MIVSDVQAFIQKFSPGGVNLTQGSHTGEARRAEARGLKGREGGRVLGEGGSKPPSPPARDLGERCKLPQWGLAGTERQKILIFLHIWDPQNAK